MRPVKYADHCASCHPLSVRLLGNAAGIDVHAAVERFAREPAPHEPPPGVRAALRERLLTWLSDLPVVAESPPEPLRPIGARWFSSTQIVLKRPERDLTDEDRRHFVADQLAHVERILFDQAGGCGFCHQKKGEFVPVSAGELPVFERTSMPTRWQSRARFRHAAHRMTGCVECHPAASSHRSGDVLIPSLDTCARCHNRSAGARHDCAECHTYHRPQP